MPKKSKLTKEQKQLIIKLAKSVPVTDIARLVGISVQYCYYIASQATHKPLPHLPPEEDKRRKLMPDDIENVRWLYTHGIPQKDIARIYKVSQCAVRYHLLTDEERTELNKQRQKYGTSQTKEYLRQQARNIYNRKKKLKEKQQ